MRARNIKPGFFENPDLAELGPCAQVLFAGLWCLADRAGRLKDDVRWIRAKIFPYYHPNPTIEKLLEQLSDKEFIVRYENGASNYIQILNFLKHQTPHVRESESIIPQYDSTSQKALPRNCLDLCQASPRSPDSLIPDSLIPDSLIPEEIHCRANSTPRTEKPPVEEIVSYLNQRTGKQFLPNTKKTITLITARFREGFCVDDFYRVIDNKTDKWLGDPKMVDFLRPETLFGTKFESYLNERDAKPSRLKGIVSEKTERTITNLQNWSPKNGKC